MLIRKAYKFRLDPDSDQCEQLSRNAGCCRFVWNKALALQKEVLEREHKRYSYTELCAFLKSWKSEESLAWLKEADSQALQQSLKNLDRAFKNAFNPKLAAQFPVFKKRGYRDSFCYPQRFQFRDSEVSLPKIGWVSFRQSRDIEGVPKNVTVSRKGRHWFFSVQVEVEVADPQPVSTSHTGIDLGVARFATLSSGQYFVGRHSFRKLEKKLAKEQRKLSRKVKFSSNWKKQQLKVQQVHIDIANARSDYLHKVSTTISKNHALVVMEDLQVSSMSRSAKGSIEEPGRGVKAKSGLNKSILDQGWFSFRQMLEYKLSWRGGELRLVPPQYTSQRCFQCGHTAKENRKKQDTFLCVSCGYSAHADLVASKNILAVGHAAAACGEIKRLAA